jgi:hypothetical protein
MKSYCMSVETITITKYSDKFQHIAEYFQTEVNLTQINIYHEVRINDYFHRVYTRPGKHGKVMQFKNRPKSHGKSWKFKENLEKS